MAKTRLNQLSARKIRRAAQLVAMWALLPAVLIILPPGGPAYGQRPAKHSIKLRSGAVLHERLPASLLIGRSDQVVRSRSGKGLPKAIDTAMGRIDKPKAADPGEPAPRYLPAPKAGTTPPPRIKADDQTGKQGTLHYRVVFNPSVAPFKRDLVFDQVTAQGELAMSGVGLKPVRPRGATARPGHELFWGHVTLELQPGQRTPMPTVAPTSALLSVQSTPAVALNFWRDRAGNLSVSTPSKGATVKNATVKVDLRFVMDAPSRYFASPISAGPVKDDPWTPRLAAELQARMQSLWPAMGVSRSQSRRANLNALAVWFRAFEPRARPSRVDGVSNQDGDNNGGSGGSGGNGNGGGGAALLSTLIVNKTGVCRHRSMGLVVVAHSLGIPAHYVMNDAHAFAEVWAPGRAGSTGGWMRLDLGGGADELQLHSARAKKLHQPLFRDPFPKPRAYANQTGGGVSRGGGSSWAGAQRVDGAEAFSGVTKGAPQQANGTRNMANRPENQGERAQTTDNDSRKHQAWLRDRALALAAPPSPPSNKKDTDDKRLPTRVVLKASAQAWVGEVFQLSGRLHGLRPGTTSQALEVWLVRPRDPSQGRLIGTATTTKGGKFRAKIAIPLDARLGVWDLIVRYGGNATYGSSFSR